MANYNRTIMIGRLTRDPEERKFASGSGVANLGFVTNNRRKNQSSGQWEDEPMFIDCKVFGKGADAIMQFARKGSKIMLEGHLVLEQWDDKSTGAKRSKHVLVIDSFQFLDGKRQEDSPPRQHHESAAPDIDPLPF